MPIPLSAVAVAQQQQNQAAHSGSPQVRLIAGPGTGKSSAIEERVRWLIEQGVEPGAIFAVSFTRASTSDLRTRIRSYCAKKGLNANEVSVSTLHSSCSKTAEDRWFP